MNFTKAVVIVTILGLGLVALNFSNKENGDKPEVSNSANASFEELFEGIEFDMPMVQLPVIPDNEANIKDFGGIGNGLADNSLVFQKTIEHVSKLGGGKVIVPRGIWLTGPITLKSNIDLHTLEGALIIFDGDFDKYPLIETSFEGLETYRCLSPINGKNLENVAITGKGVFDGSGGSWRPVKKSKLTSSHWKKLVKSGGVLSDDKNTWYPSELSKNGDSNDNFNVPDFSSKEEFKAVKDFLRPVMVSLIKCKKVLLDGPTFQNSPAWNLHPLMCEDITLRNLTIRNPWFSQNGDGVDLESCKNAIIYNCSFDVGDDAICFKSGKNEDGLKRGMPTENVIVKNNIVYHGHGGFTIGSETSGGVRNVHISDCTFIGTDCGLRFKSTRGRGGVVENIYISNIDMVNIPAEAIRFNLYYGGESPIPSDGNKKNKSVKREIVPVSILTPSFKSIYMKNITATGSGVAAFFQGLPEMKLSDIHLENVFLEAKKGITMIDAKGIYLKNVSVMQDTGPAMILFNTKQLEVSSFKYKPSINPVFNIYGEETENIVLQGFDVDMSSLKLSEEVDENAIVIK
ncbi:MAG: polygalacturonase [Parvicella sp.]|jgi:polygalacturonase